jgi:hypothetical protein
MQNFTLNFDHQPTPTDSALSCLLFQTFNVVDHMLAQFILFLCLHYGCSILLPADVTVEGTFDNNQRCSEKREVSIFLFTLVTHGIL